jgi:predicted ATPase
LLPALPSAAERVRAELTLRMILTPVLTATRGFTAVEAAQNLQRARQLCQLVDDPTLSVPVLTGLGRVHLLQADCRAIAELTAEARRVLDQVTAPALALQLHGQLGTFAVFRGAHAEAQRHYAHVLALFDPKIHGSIMFTAGMDPSVNTLCFTAFSNCHTGYLDQARRQIEQGLARAEAIAHPFSLVLALSLARFVLNFHGEFVRARQLMERCFVLATEHGFPLYALMSVLGDGSISVQRGEAEVGIPKLREGLIRHRATGAQLFLPYYLSFLAEAYQRLARPDEGLQVIAEALGLMETNWDRHWEAELYRLKGELILQSTVHSPQSAVKKGPKSKVQSPKSKGPDTQYPTPNTQVEAAAEACFLRAIEIARRQEARLLELRTTLSLSRLWRRQGKRDAARRQLTEIYGWFTEGFETPDLQAAQALLAELR